MNRTKQHSKGDLVTWRANGNVYTGVVLESWESNIYEPAECNVLLPEGGTSIIPSKNLKSLQRAKVTDE